MSAQIIAQLKALSLHGMAASVPELAAQARHTEFNPESFVQQLMAAESAQRVVRSTAYQGSAGNVWSGSTVSHRIHAQPPDAHRTTRLRWTSRRQNLISDMRQQRDFLHPTKRAQ